MLAEDVVTVHGRLEGLLLVVVAGEALLGVGDVETAVGGALQSAEDAGTGGGAGETDIETGAEGTGSVVLVLDAEDLSVDLGLALVGLVESELVEDAAGEEEAGAVGGGVVGESDLHAVAGELVRVGGGHNLVSLQTGVRYLAGDVAVGGAHDHTVLGGVVFVLVLDDQALAGVVVGLTLPAPAELDLVPLEVRLVLHNLDERL